MRKFELLDRQWKAFLDEIDPARMEQPGVNGDRSMREIRAWLAREDKE